MVRVGINPARDRKSSYRPARVTVAILVYIPYLGGYFKEKLEVLGLSLTSLFRNTGEVYDLLVFDNGSCEEVRSYLRTLHSDGSIRYLIHSSENIGKIGALQMIFGAAPGELVAYADDDIFFYPGWLKAELEIFNVFPKTGMVSGCAVRSIFDYGGSSARRLAEEHNAARIEKVQWIDEQREAQWAESVGRNVEVHLQSIETIQESVLHFEDSQAYAAANHFQFLADRQMILDHLPSHWSGRLMGEMIALDESVDRAGYLRLSTIEQFTRHIGNTIGESMTAEAAGMGIEIGESDGRHAGAVPSRIERRLFRSRRARRLLQGIYNRLFWVLSQESGTWAEPDQGRNEN